MLVVKQFDDRNAVHAQLKKDGEPLNLSGCKVLISISGGTVYKSDCIIADEALGEVYFPLEYQTTAKSGSFRYDFTVEYPDGRHEGFPNDGYLELRVMKEIKE